MEVVKQDLSSQVPMFPCPFLKTPGSLQEIVQTKLSASRVVYAHSCVCERMELVINTFVKDWNSCLTIPSDLWLHKISSV